MELSFNLKFNERLTLNPINNVVNKDNNNGTRITYQAQTLWEILQDDKLLTAYFKFVGFYWSTDKKDHIILQILLKLWLITLFLLGAYGFIMRSLVVGGAELKNFFDVSYNTNTNTNTYSYSYTYTYTNTYT